MVDLAGGQVTPIDEVFNDEMELARSMQGSTAEYWQGYAAGLTLARFGHLAFHDEYQKRLAQMDTTGELARGYRDGYSRLSRLRANGSPGRHADPVWASRGAE